jgi:Protein of unknown function (DUF3025)
LALAGLTPVSRTAIWDESLATIKATHDLPDSPFELSPKDYLKRLSAAATNADLRNSQGLRIEFVAAQPLGATSYEAMIFESGKVPTRLPEVGAASIDVIHDFLNALMWFAWPRTKAALNAAQYQSTKLSAKENAKENAKAVVDLSGASNSQRGVYRDRLTLLDESGVVVVCTEALAALFKARQWPQLFYDNRTAMLRGEFQVFVIGHGLLQRLKAPFKSITAHAWVIEGAEQMSVDERMALQVPSLNRSQPLPVMGLPDWHRSWFEGEQDAAFYNDQNVFRVPVCE